MKKSPYARRSKLLWTLSKYGLDDGEFKLGTYSGMQGTDKSKSADYFKISPMEDYLSKLGYTFRNHMIFPTMADKKTYHTLHWKDKKKSKASEDIFTMPHDLLTYENTKFSKKTIEQFYGYFLDELESLIQYYSRDNIKDLLDHPASRYKNFHGKFSSGRMDFSGNGGKFRYFHQAINIKTQDGKTINLNEFLEFVYNYQKHVEKNGTKSGLAKIRDQKDGEYLDFDGFELVRKVLTAI